MIINNLEFRDKVLACWFGKNIGGTLGAPFEWFRQTNHVDFYSQDLTGEPAPNDDLDVQLLWLIALEERGVELTAHTLSEYWQLYLTPHWAEYGTGKINMRAGLLPPLCGTQDNDYKDSCGSFLRSEIWACIAPGNPGLAARYAFQDSIIDHGNGEGTYAEVFCAALESAAFVCQDIPTLIQIALTYIPDSCGVAGAVRDSVNSYQTGKSWLEARNSILDKYRGSTFYNRRSAISDEDYQRGFGSGKQGWDVPSNIGIIIIGLLYGEGDFGKSICTAVNCGEDTDCTGATLGSLFGILHGTNGIPPSWIAPIGRSIRSACLNLGELGNYGNLVPASVDDLTDRTIRITHQVLSRFPQAVSLSEQPTDLKDLQLESLKAGPEMAQLFQNLGGPIFHFDFFDIALDYGPDGAVAHEMTPKTITLHIYNQYKIQANFSIRWYTPDAWKVSPTKEGTVMSFPSGFNRPVKIDYNIEIGAFHGPSNRAVIELTIEGRNTVMLIPVLLQNKL